MGGPTSQVPGRIRVLVLRTELHAIECVSVKTMQKFFQSCPRHRISNFLNRVWYVTDGLNINVFVTLIFPKSSFFTLLSDEYRYTTNTE